MKFNIYILFFTLLSLFTTSQAQVLEHIGGIKTQYLFFDLHRDGSDLYAASDGGLYKAAAHSTTFELIEDRVGDFVNTIRRVFTDSHFIYVKLFNDEIWRIDKATNELLKLNPKIGAFRGIEDALFFIDNSSTLQVSWDGGLSWTPSLEMSNITSLAYGGKLNRHLAGQNGRIYFLDFNKVYESQDKGKTWEVVHEDTEELSAIAATEDVIFLEKKNSVRTLLSYDNFESFSEELHAVYDENTIRKYTQNQDTIFRSFQSDILYKVDISLDFGKSWQVFISQNVYEGKWILAGTFFSDGYFVLENRGGLKYNTPTNVEEEIIVEGTSFESINKIQLIHEKLWIKSNQTYHFSEDEGTTWQPIEEGIVPFYTQNSNETFYYNEAGEILEYDSTTDEWLTINTEQKHARLVTTKGNLWSINFQEIWQFDGNSKTWKLFHTLESTEVVNPTVLNNILVVHGNSNIWIFRDESAAVEVLDVPLCSFFDRPFGIIDNTLIWRCGATVPHTYHIQEDNKWERFFPQNWEKKAPLNALYLFETSFTTEHGIWTYAFSPTIIDNKLLLSSNLKGYLYPIELPIYAYISTVVSHDDYIYLGTGKQGLFRLKLHFDEEHVEKSLAIYPNPVYHTATLVSDFSIKEAPLIRIFDANGKEVYSTEDIAGFTWQLDVAHLPSGVYFVNLKSAHSSETIRFIKK